MYSKYERRTDTRTYEDRRKLYEGGWEVVRAEHLQALWKEKYDEWLKRPKSKYLSHCFHLATFQGHVTTLFLQPSCPSGSVRGPAKRLETQSPLKTKMRVVPRLPLLRITKKKRKKKKRRKKKKKRKRKKKRRKKKSKSRSKFCDDHTNHLSPSIHPYEEEIRAKQKTRNPTRPWIECFSIFFVTL